MERTPILTQQEGVAIRLIETPLTINGMLPAYYYQFQAGTVSEEASHMYDELIGFLRTNEELVINESVNSRDDYVKGFQKALAMTKLWIDSIYLQESEE